MLNKVTGGGSQAGCWAVPCNCLSFYIVLLRGCRCQVLLEFKEYATEVDVDFVRKAVRAIGYCAISIQSAAERCINVLLELISTKVNYVVQESIVVIKDIFRCHLGSVRAGLWRQWLCVHAARHVAHISASLAYPPTAWPFFPYQAVPQPL
jgi:hypothetical protein